MSLEAQAPGVNHVRRAKSKVIDWVIEHCFEFSAMSCSCRKPQNPRRDNGFWACPKRRVHVGGDRRFKRMPVALTMFEGSRAAYDRSITNVVYESAFNNGSMPVPGNAGSAVLSP